MTIEEIREEVYALTHEQMAHLYRFAPPGHKYFDKTNPACDIFYERWEDLGGMTTQLSKKIGWER